MTITDTSLTTKWCKKCEAVLPVSEFNFNRSSSDGLTCYCSFHENERVREEQRKRRREFIDAMGGECVRCHFDDIRALQVDHVNGDGAAERTAGVRKDTRKYFDYVLAHRDRYQLLCANCNWIKRVEEKEASGPRNRGPKPTMRLVPGRNLSRLSTWRCPNGHEPVEENIYVRPDGRRECRPCKNRGPSYLDGASQ